MAYYNVFETVYSMLKVPTVPSEPSAQDGVKQHKNQPQVQVGILA